MRPPTTPTAGSASGATSSRSHCASTVQSASVNATTSPLASRRAAVARRGRPAPFLAQHPQPRPIAREDGGRRVGGRVVDGDQLDLIGRIIQPQQGVEARAHGRGPVADGDDDRRARERGVHGGGSWS
jgi:hypothetical protein